MARGCQWGHGNCEFFCVFYVLQFATSEICRSSSWEATKKSPPPELVEARTRGVANAWIIFVVLIFPSLQPQRGEFAAVVREKQSWFRDRMCNRITAHARLCNYHLVRAAPRHPANVSRSQIEICQRSPFSDSSNRKSWGPAPPAWVPILWLTTVREKNTGDGGWCHAVGPTTCKADFVVQKVGEKPDDQVVWMCCFFCARKRSKNAHFWWAIVRAILVYIL